MTYIIRNDKGIMNAKVSNIVANIIINGTDGEFFKHASGTTRFRIRTASVYSIGVRGSSIDLYLWEGDVLIPVDD